MGTLMAASQVLRWAVRNATPAVFSPLQFGRCPLQPLCSSCRLLCSSSDQRTLQQQQQQQQHSSHKLSLHSTRRPVTELSPYSLLDMGFTDIQAEQIQDVVSKVRGAGATKHALSALTALFVLGLNPSSVLKVMEKCPELCTINESQFQQRLVNLRKLGLIEGSLQRVVAHYPQILTVPVKSMKHVVMFLREKCLFTVQQVTDILRDSPTIVRENMDQLEYKFQYVYFRMGVKQAEMVKARLFRFTLDDVRQRHCFLERRGLYQTPDKKGQTLIVNPKLDSILHVDEDTFLKHVAKASAEEFDVFKRLMARECKESEQHQLQGSIDADSNDDEDDEEEDEDKESEGKSGYLKRRKKR